MNVDFRPNYAGERAKVLGIIQIVCGILSIVFQVVSIIILAGFFPVGHGIWGGVFVSCQL